MRRHVAVLACLIALSGLSQTSAQTPRPPARDQASLSVPTGTAELRGIVEAADHRPLPRASVTIDGDMALSQTVATDDEGRFSFTDLPAGRFTVTAVKGGYPAMSYGAARPNRPGAGILLAEGAPPTTITLTLLPGAVITGTVFDDRGRPMPDVPISLWTVHTPVGGTRTLGPANAFATSDDRGIYRVFGLAPGDYVVGTQPIVFSELASDVRVPTDAEIREAFLAAQTGAPRPTTAPATAVHVAYATTFAPGTTEPDAAVAISVRPGEVRDGADLHLQYQRLSHIEGVVTLPDGSPAPNAAVSLVPASHVGPSFIGWRAGADGHFTSKTLAPGDYTIGAMTAQPNGTLVWARTAVTVTGPDPTVVPLRLQPALTLSGHIAFAGAASPPADLSKIELAVQPVERTGTQTQRPTIDATGAFTVVGLTPGSFVIRASVPGASAWTVESIRLGEADVTDRAFDLGTTDPPPVTIRFTDQTAAIAGTVSAPAGQHASDYFVVMLPADPTYWIPNSRRIRSVRPGLDGQFTVSGLPPGSYRLAATTDLVPADLTDSAALSALAAQSVAVDLKTGETRTVHVAVGGGR